MSKMLTANAIARLRYILEAGITHKQDELVDALRDKMLLDQDADEDTETILVGVIRYLQQSAAETAPEWAYTRHVVSTIDEVLQ